ncbi:acyl-CoA dehydrogenase family protein [Tersicoccus sp. MR15.9]|uniref:acyl-CoA dehydrogenase family protein n=1 Tax=Tersicoccus mangrovi TaxID=3121635 RepID=UPI002FE57230
MKRTFFTEDQELFREVAAEFVRREVTPHYRQWDEDHLMPRSVWTAAGEQGLVGLAVPEEHGGAGLDDYRFRMVLDEELAKGGALGLALAFHLHDDLVLPALLAHGTDEQKERWLPAMASGELVTSCAWTEPGAGSDLRAVRTRAVPDGDGGWRLSGQKTFIGNGISGDAALVLARTDGSTGRGGEDSFSLFFVEKGEGYTTGKQLNKMGLRASDTAELFFDDVAIPAGNLIGELGAGLRYVREALPQARLAIAAAASVISRQAYEQAVTYTADRSVFGGRVLDLPTTRFSLADLLTEVEVTEGYVDRAVLAFNDGDLSPAEAARVKLWASERATSITDRCLQLHGGYGYILEYPIAQAFIAARLLTIFGGTSEIMKQTIGREIAGPRPDTDKDHA